MCKPMRELKQRAALKKFPHPQMQKCCRLFAQHSKTQFYQCACKSQLQPMNLN